MGLEFYSYYLGLLPLFLVFSTFIAQSKELIKGPTKQTLFCIYSMEQLSSCLAFLLLFTFLKLSFGKIPVNFPQGVGCG
jgi:hypothetical protein